VLEKHTHCSYCGHAYDRDQPWPRTCAKCGNTTWRNPIPVVVILARVVGGVVGIRRGIQPGKGKLALPGGYVDYGETVEVAAAREWHEETGELALPISFEVCSTQNSSGHSKLLIFVELVEGLDGMLDRLPLFVPNEEVTELVVLRGDEELAFPTHTATMRDFLAQERGGSR